MPSPEGPSTETEKNPITLETKEVAEGNLTVRQLIEREIATLDDKPGLSAREKWVAQRVFSMETKHGIRSLDTQIKTQQALDALRTEIKKTVDRYRDD
ncbi:MAG: hypothetical protein WCW30_00860, partial [Candidatus Gracilibacteria bacterium]